MHGWLVSNDGLQWNFVPDTGTRPAASWKQVVEVYTSTAGTGAVQLTTAAGVPITDSNQLAAYYQYVASQPARSRERRGI